MNCMEVEIVARLGMFDLLLFLVWSAERPVVRISNCKNVLDRLT